MLPLPKQSQDERRLADWLEFLALLSSNNISSSGDLESALKKASLFDPKNAADDLPTRVFAELSARSKAAAGGYPFTIDGSLVRARPKAIEFESYLFCLCLSYVDLTPKKGKLSKPERIFEALCTTAAAKFVHGKARRFGWPRHNSEFKPSFKSAIDELSLLIGEGGLFRPQQGVSTSGDGGLDIVAWRDHADMLPGKLLVFGACAAGKNWNEKIYELQPDAFTENYMNDSLASEVVRAFFVPHRVPAGDEWTRLVRGAGMVFDRCRIASLVRRLPKPSPHGDGVGWIKEQLRTFKKAA